MEREEDRRPRSGVVEMLARESPYAGGGATEHGHDAAMIFCVTAEESSGQADRIGWRNEWTSKYDRIRGGRWARGTPTGALE
jgi:hypothetical protein